MILTYKGEYGPEIVCFIPYVYYLKTNNIEFSVNTYKGMRPYYYFLEEHKYSEREENRCHILEKDRDFLPEEVKSEHQFMYEDKWIPPSYNHYRMNPIVTKEKPVFVIHNKYNVEWGIGPINFLDEKKISDVLDKICNDYTVVYIRPWKETKGYSLDHNTLLDMNEFDWIRKKYPTVIIFQDIIESDYNSSKLRLYAQADHILCVQGGNSYLGAYFDAAVHVSHRRGEEARVNSYNGWFTKINGRYNKKITVDYTDNDFYEWLNKL